jgi:hypothetical protein
MSKAAGSSPDDVKHGEALLARELAELSDESRTRVILGALTLATDPTRRRRYLSADTIAALGAIVVAVASLVLAIDQTRTQRKQLAAAVWPSVRVVYSNFEDAAHPQHRLYLANGGVGPARIQSFSISWQGKPVTDVNDWSKAACPNVPRDWVYGTQTGQILSPGAPGTIVSHERETARDDDRCIQETMLGKAEVSVCYCSALEDCWVVSRGAEPEPVRDCRDARRQPQFEYGD